MLNINANDPPAKPRQYRAFVSYSHEDWRDARFIHRKLERFRVPTDLRVGNDGAAALSPIFIDQLELASSSDLDGALRSALENSRYLLVVCSPSAVKSERVNSEVAHFIRVHGRENVLPVMVAGRPNAASRGFDAQQECLPLALRVEAADAAPTPAPLAADMRAGKGSRSDAITRLAAGMLGVGFDALRRRDAQRRYRRLIGITATACALTAVTAGLALYAWNARDQAMRNEARAALEARRAEEVANFLVSIFRVSNPAESLGATVTARELLDRGAAQIGDHGVGGDSIQSTLLLTIGSVYRQLGLYDQARTHLESAVRFRRAQPDNSKKELADALFQLALLNSRTDKRPEAERQFKESIELLDPCAENLVACSSRYESLAFTLVAENRKDDAMKALLAAEQFARAAESGDSAQLARVLSVYALIYREQADFEKAAKYSQEALAMRERIYGSFHPDVSKSHYDHAHLLQEAKDFKAAVVHLEKALAIDEKVYGPEHPETLTSLQMMGILHAEQSDFAAARPYFERVLAIRERVLGTNHTDTGYAAYNLGHLYGDLGSLDDALKLMRRAQAIWERSEGAHHPDVAYALDKQAEYLLRQGNFRDAEPLAWRALEINGASFPKDHPNVARSHLNIARVYIAQGNLGAAREHYDKGLSAQASKFGADAALVQATRREFEPLLAKR